MGLQADMRAAAVTLLTDYAASASIGLQVYPGRVRTVMPPTAFVDLIRETVNHETALTRREPTVEMIVLWGLYDSKDAVEQADAFKDGFVAWCETRFHAAGGNTISGLVSLEDEPTYVNDWVAPAEQRTFYATRLSLEGSGGI